MGRLLGLASCGGDATPLDAHKPAAVYTLDPSFGVDGVVTLPVSVFDGAQLKFLATRAGLVVAMVTLTNEVALCRLTNEAALDPSFGGGGTGCRTAPDLSLAAVTDGTDIYVATRSSLAPAIHRFRGDGTIDTAWGTNGVLALAPPPPTPPDSGIPTSSSS